ncbi:MAG: hypothetical protein ACAI38_16575 [Myxococcota bacterium]
MPVETRTQSPIGLSFPPLATSKMLPVPVKELPSVESLKRSLIATAAELSRRGTELEKLTRDTFEQRAHARLMRVAGRLEEGGYHTGGAVLGMTMIGCLVGAFAGYVGLETTRSLAVAWAAAGTVGGLCILTPPLAMWLVPWSKRTTAPAPPMVELGSLSPELERFKAAEGPTKIQACASLAAVRDDLHQRQMLSPEALAALNAAVDEAVAAEARGDASARPLLELARLLSEPLDAAAVERAKAQLALVPAAERACVAQAVHEVVFADRKRIQATKYPVRNALHELLTGATKASPQTG